MRPPIRLRCDWEVATTICIRELSRLVLCAVLFAASAFAASTSHPAKPPPAAPTKAEPAPAASDDWLKLDRVTLSLTGFADSGHLRVTRSSLSQSSEAAG